MASVYRIRAVWSGFQGAPGYSNFYFSDLTTDTVRNTAATNVKTFFTALAAYFLNTWTIQVQGTVDEFNMNDGSLVGSAAITSVPGATVGVATPVAYAGGSGMVISWKTSTIYHGRRLQGRTFIVPAVGCFQNDGTLTTQAMADGNSAAGNLITPTSPDLVIWGKRYDSSKPPNQIDGLAASVTSSAVKDMAAQLRSRRL